MLKLASKEHLLHYFLNHEIKLSTYDQKFLHNLEYLIAKFHRITTNQKALFEKLISKYSKQFGKVGFDKEELKSLPWTTPVVESTAEFTGAQVSLLGNNLVLKVPFNKHFISDFRSMENNSFEWNRNDKKYMAPLSTYALKIANTILPKYFKSTTYSIEVMELLNQVVPYEADVWKPTYLKSNGNYYVGAINQYLYDHIKDLNFDDNPKTLFNLSQYGITVDKSVTCDDPKKIFASEFNTVIDLDNLSTVLVWLKELDVDMVYFGRGLSGANTRREITSMIESLNISVSTNPKFYTDDDAINPVMLKLTDTADYLPHHKGKRLFKYIKLQISRPVNVK